MMAKNKPTIIVTRPDNFIDLTRLFFRWALWVAGAKCVFVTPKDTTKDLDFDALILSGGTDIEPLRYGEPLDDIVQYDIARDDFEFKILDLACARTKPVLGICRGMQLINIHFGGTLITDLKKLFDQLYLPQSFWARAIYRKPVYACSQSFLNDGMIEKQYRVNSIHHQSIKNWGQGLRVVAKDEHNIIQAIEHTDKEIYGVQWHPEYMPFSQSQRNIFKQFIAKIPKE